MFANLKAAFEGLRGEFFCFPAANLPNLLNRKQAKWIGLNRSGFI